MCPCIFHAFRARNPSNLGTTWYLPVFMAFYYYSYGILTCTLVRLFASGLLDYVCYAACLGAVGWNGWLDPPGGDPYQLEKSPGRKSPNYIPAAFYRILGSTLGQE